MEKILYKIHIDSRKIRGLWKNVESEKHYGLQY